MKKLLLIAGALSMLGLSPLSSHLAFAKDSEVRVGILNGFSGGRGIFGRDQRDGFMLALDHLGGKLGGIPAKVVVGDTQHKPDIGRQVMDKFIKKDKVHFVTGVTWSNVLAAVYKQATKNKIFLIGSNAGWSKLAGKGCNADFFLTSWENGTTPESMGKALGDSGKSVYLLAPNYQAGKDMLAGFMRYYNGKVVGRTLFKLGNTDWQSELTQIRAAKPGSVYAFAPGGMGVSLIKQFNAAGLNKDISISTSFVVDYMTLKAFGKDAIGNTHTSIWDADSTIPANVKFKKDFIAKFGRHPSAFAVQGYDAAMVINLGVKGANGDLSNRDAMRAAMRTAAFDSPRGNFKFNNNHFPIQDFYKREVIAGDNGEPKIITTGKVFSSHKDAYYKECKMSW